MLNIIIKLQKTKITKEISNASSKKIHIVKMGTIIWITEILHQKSWSPKKQWSNSFKCRKEKTTNQNYVFISILQRWRQNKDIFRWRKTKRSSKHFWTPRFLQKGKKEKKSKEITSSWREITLERNLDVQKSL